MTERRPSQQTLRFVSGGVQRAIASGSQLPLLQLALLVLLMMPLLPTAAAAMAPHLNACTWKLKRALHCASCSLYQ